MTTGKHEKIDRCNVGGFKDGGRETWTKVFEQPKEDRKEHSYTDTLILAQ
jgi:hypothetical protein